MSEKVSFQNNLPSPPLEETSSKQPSHDVNLTSATIPPVTTPATLLAHLEVNNQVLALNAVDKLFEANPNLTQKQLANEFMKLGSSNSLQLAKTLYKNRSQQGWWNWGKGFLKNRSQERIQFVKQIIEEFMKADHLEKIGYAFNDLELLKTLTEKTYPEIRTQLEQLKSSKDPAKHQQVTDIQAYLYNELEKQNFHANTEIHQSAPGSFIGSLFKRSVSVISDHLRKKIFVDWSNKQRHIANLKELEALQRKPNKTDADLKQITLLQGYIEKTGKILESAKKTREALAAIGATPIKITTSDGAVLDSVHVSADQFLEKLKAAGAQRVSVNCEGSTRSGFVFQVSAPELFKTLTNLGLGNISDIPSDTKGKEYEWLRINHGDQVLILHNIPENQKLLTGPTETLTFKTKEIDTTPQKRGTVILTSGANGVYEAHKREIMSLLARGLNVMCFNYRGYGQSEGVPNENSIKTDIDAVYDYLTQVQHVKNEDITVKALCMSGAAGTHLAAKYPGVNLFLDQTYSDFRNYIALETDRALAQMPVFRKLPGKMFNATSWMISSVMRNLAPAWSVKEEISQVNGYVGVLITSDDVNTPPEEAFENISALLKAGNDKVKVYQMPGKHADSWMDAKQLDITPELFKLERYEPLNAQSLGNLFTEFEKAPSVEVKKRVLNEIIEKTTPMLKDKSFPEDQKTALAKLNNEATRLLEPIPTKKQAPLFPGRASIDDFFQRMGHYKPLTVFDT